jgi:hypothetical protein
MSNKILERFAAKTAKAGLASRGDMYVTDVQRIDNSKCRVLVGYSKLAGGVPTIPQLEQYFQQTFGNKVIAQTSSAQSHEAEAAISLLVTLNTPSRPLSDMNDMIRVSATSFMDENTKHLWQVVDTGSNKYLTREAEENVAEIVEARRSRTSKKEARFVNLKTAAPMAMAGDTVKFMSPQNVVLMGEISTISDAKATIKANGGSFSVDRQAIIQVVERASKSVQSNKNILEDYFTKAYGDPAFAKQLTDKQSQDLHGLGTTVPATPSVKVPGRKDGE